MFAIISLLVVLTVSILVTRVAALALTHTGLSKQSARFQARSAFTGVGFTTEESEKVVNHPVRRRILLVLMILGNAGVVTAISSLIVTFIDVENTMSTIIRIVFLTTGLVALWTAAYSRWIDKHLSRVINRALKRFTDLDVKDYSALLHLAGEYAVAEMQIQPDDWLSDKFLKQTRLRDEGVAVLGITRTDGTYIGVPHGETKLRPYDTLTLYGRASSLEELDERRQDRGGEIEHRKAVKEQEEAERKESREDPAARAEESGDSETSTKQAESNADDSSRKRSAE